MIRTEFEYRETLKRLGDAAETFRQEETRLKARGLDRAAVKRALEPGQAFHAQLRAEVETYERLKRGEFDELRNLQGIGHLLIGARIASGLSQRELAERLSVHESQVSRDERNEYNGITVERAERILDILGIETVTRARKVKDLAKSA